MFGFGDDHATCTEMREIEWSSLLFARIYAKYKYYGVVEDTYPRTTSYS